jgi:hypothetical protein
MILYSQFSLNCSSDPIIPLIVTRQWSAPSLYRCKNTPFRGSLHFLIFYSYYSILIYFVPYFQFGAGQLSQYCDLLWDGQSGDWITVEARFFTLSRLALRPTHPPVQGVPGILPWGKSAGAWHWPPTPSNAEVKERVELYLSSASEPSWSVLGRTLPFYFQFNFLVLNFSVF